MRLENEEFLEASLQDLGMSPPVVGALERLDIINLRSLLEMPLAGLGELIGEQRATEAIEFVKRAKKGQLKLEKFVPSDNPCLVLHKREKHNG